MSRQPYNQIWKKQHAKLTPSTFKKAFINAVHVSSNTVDIYYASNPQSIIKNITVAHTVDITLIVPGQRCRIDIIDETNPNDIVCAYTY